MYGLFRRALLSMSLALAVEVVIAVMNREGWSDVLNSRLDEA